MSSYLAKIVAATLATVGLSGAVHAQSYCDPYDHSCYVTAPVCETGCDPDPNPDGPGDGSGGGSGDGGSGDGGPPPPPPVCSLLLATRPQGECVGPISTPSSAFYGPEYSSSSALGRMQNFASDQNGFAVMRERLTAGLNAHTSGIAAGASFLDSNAQLRSVVAEVCGTLLPELLASTDPSAQMIERGVSNQFCVSLPERFDQEASGILGFVDWVMQDFSNVGSVDFNDIPWSGTFTNFFGDDNSLQRKFAAVVVDTTCSNWWTQFNANGCGP